MIGLVVAVYLAGVTVALGAGYALGLRAIGFTLKRRLTPAQRKEVAGWLEQGDGRELGDQIR